MIHKVDPSRLDKNLTTDICHALMREFGGPSGLARLMREVIDDNRATPYIRLQVIRTVLDFTKFEDTKHDSSFNEKLSLMTDDELLTSVKNLLERKNRKFIDVEPANGEG